MGAAGLALLTIEGPRTLMVVADYITIRWLNPLKERLRAEGRAEGQAEWIAWNERRMEAEAKGEPFSEPPPKLPAEPKQDNNEPLQRTYSTKGE